MLTRRATVASGLALAASGTIAGDTGAVLKQSSATPASSPSPDHAAQIIAIAEDAAAEMDLRAVIMKVSIDGEKLVTHALGESMTGVPATPDMHFRNGAVAISYVSTVLLRLVDDGTVQLDDTIDQWLPDLPDAGRVTLRMLADMTAGYPDFVQNPDFEDAFNSDPFRHWTSDDQLAFGFSTPRSFEPGTNWDYSHTNYVILGQALEVITGASLEDLIQQHVIAPLGLAGTGTADTAWMPEPVLHAFSSERRAALGIPESVRFYEESTFWNPSWTLPQGAVQYSTIHDLVTTAEAIGRGTLLSQESHQAQVEPRLVGFGEPLQGCPTCHTLDEVYNYGLGIVRSGGWLLQNPLFGGYGAIEGYHPGRSIAIAVATTFGEGSFDEVGNYRHGNASQRIFVRTGELLVPDDPPLLS